MSSITPNKVILFVVVLGVLLVGFHFSSNLLIDKIAKRVEEKLRSDYTPGPYQPGFNPDKVDPTWFKKAPSQQSPSPSYQRLQTDDQFPNPSDWNALWEAQRK